MRGCISPLRRAGSCHRWRRGSRGKRQAGCRERDPKLSSGIGEAQSHGVESEQGKGDGEESEESVARLSPEPEKEHATVSDPAARAPERRSLTPPPRSVRRATGLRRARRGRAAKSRDRCRGRG